MNSWEIIKREFTKNKLPGTVGEQLATAEAATLFVALENNLADRDEAVDAFNNDWLAPSSFLVASALRGAGVTR